MEIGEVFKYDAHGKVREAAFKRYEGDQIVAILRDDARTQGIEVKINKNLVIQDDQKN